MNLIEQLGGYAEASRELELKEQNSVLQCCIAVTAEMIREALLQYRREHNIFEVGDKVVYKDNKEDDFVNKNSLFEVFELCGNGVVYVKDTDENCDFLHIYNYSNEFRHATDAEIEAGKRL